MKNLQIILVVVILTTGYSCASELTGVTIADFSTEQSAYSRYAVNIVNGSGLDGIYHDNLASHMWQSADLDLTPWIILDLGGMCDLSGLYIWNYNAYDQSLSYTTWFGIKELEVYITQDSDFSSATWTLVDTFDLNKAPDLASSNYFFVDYLSLNSLEATYLKLLVKKNYITELGWTGSKWNDGNQSGISEVKVYGERQATYGYIENVEVEDYSSESLAWGFRAAANTVNGSGFENGVHCMGWDFSWQAVSDDAPHYLIWDLGGDCVVGDIQVWNLNADINYNWMASKGIDIYISDDNISYSYLKSAVLSYPEFNDDYDTPDIIDLGGINTRYVKMVINSNYGTNPRYVGLDEVKFVGYRFKHEVSEKTIGVNYDISGPQNESDSYVDSYDWTYLLNLIGQ